MTCEIRVRFQSRPLQTNRSFYNGADLRLEAHVEHPVGLAGRTHGNAANAGDADVHDDDFDGDDDAAGEHEDEDDGDDDDDGHDGDDDDFD